MANENLGNAKKAKNDEFYTQFSDIQKEMNAYLDYNPDVFRGKTVLLPCDDPEWSNFTNIAAYALDDLNAVLAEVQDIPQGLPAEIPVLVANR